MKTLFDVNDKQEGGEESLSYEDIESYLSSKIEFENSLSEMRTVQQSMEELSDVRNLLQEERLSPVAIEALRISVNSINKKLSVGIGEKVNLTEESFGDKIQLGLVQIKDFIVKLWEKFWELMTSIGYRIKKFFMQLTKTFESANSTLDNLIAKIKSTNKVPPKERVISIPYSLYKDYLVTDPNNTRSDKIGCGTVENRLKQCKQSMDDLFSTIHEQEKITEKLFFSLMDERQSSDSDPLEKVRFEEKINEGPRVFLWGMGINDISFKNIIVDKDGDKKEHKIFYNSTVKTEPQTSGNSQEFKMEIGDKNDLIKLCERGKEIIASAVKLDKVRESYVSRMTVLNKSILKYVKKADSQTKKDPSGTKINWRILHKAAHLSFTNCIEIIARTGSSSRNSAFWIARYVTRNLREYTKKAK